MDAPSSTEGDRVDDLWFSDGSLVVRAENKAFRVSGALLAARSTVFQDMLSFPQPSAGASEIESLDEIPIVELHDPASEVEPFLRAIFDSSSFMPPPSPSELSDVLAILRLSHKYDIQYLHRRALDHLSLVYPTELPSFLAHLNSVPPGFQKLHSSAEAHLQALRVLHEVNALYLLPAAYSRASKNLPERFFSSPGWPVLPDTIKNRLYLSHTHQARHLMAIVHAAGHEDPGCQTPRTCSPYISTVITALMVSIGKINIEFNCFEMKDLFRPGLWEGENYPPICAACIAHNREQISTGMSTVWEAFPAILELPPWDKLQAMRTAAMG
ncbi:hypothetical protein DFH07DRAFT_1061197 [Mycena maculata]|uniref:BTB domain-containing protein n=1 Tax=Mycena maculata TaxID=230809 RepID=A0AAD7J523_9AGAR|nr:hypothetical protein DFH07DRAFT_1061197 [Mycena maculata]